MLQNLKITKLYRHSNIFDFTLTFSDVSAPINLEIKVAKDVATIASIIIWLLAIFFSSK